MPELAHIVAVGVDGDEERAHYGQALLLVKQVQDAAHLDQLGGADVGAMREAEVQQQELASKVRVGHGLACEVHQRPRPAQRRLSVTRHLAQGCVIC